MRLQKVILPRLLAIKELKYSTDHKSLVYKETFDRWFDTWIGGQIDIIIEELTK